MQTGILVTDGGPHPADKWAEATSSHIVSIADSLSGAKRASAFKLQAAVIDILEKHHGLVQNGEQAKLQASPDRLASGLDANDHTDLDQVVGEIVTAAAGTAWAETFALTETQTQLKALLASHFHTSMHIERSWHADRNPSLPQAQAFQSRHNVGV